MLTPKEALDRLVENSRALGNEAWGQTANDILEETAEAEGVLRVALFELDEQENE